MEGDVLRNCGFVHIKELAILAIFGVPAGELVTRTDGIMDGSQFVCLGISDFFGLINRHLSGVGQGAAIGIKGHLAEVKKIAVFQIGVGRVCKQFICIGFIAVIVDGTIGSVNRDRISIFIKNGLSIFVLFPIFIYLPSCTSLQALLERSQPGRECNVFQIKAIVKGIRFNGCYFFRDGDGLEGFATFKSLLANLSHTVRQSDRGKIFARGKSPLANDFNAPRQGECVKTITLAKGTFVDFFQTGGKGERRQCAAFSESLFSDFCQAAAQSKIRKRYAEYKSTLSNRSYFVRNLNMIQDVAIPKGMRANGCQAFREVHSGQVIAIIKHMNSG